MKKRMIGLLAAVVAISAALVGCGSNNGQSSQASSVESSVSSTVSRVNAVSYTHLLLYRKQNEIN